MRLKKFLCSLIFDNLRLEVFLFISRNRKLFTTTRKLTTKTKNELTTRITGIQVIRIWAALFGLRMLGTQEKLHTTTKPCKNSIDYNSPSEIVGAEVYFVDVI